MANLRDANNDLKSTLRKEKDIPEMTKDGNTGDVPGSEKKHVRINEPEQDTNSEKIAPTEENV